jgi:phosphoribosylaminoimidazolecarboxamide formyltransferase/IMP cyclohydrolase
VADYTGFPEMMEGRVKTLHPKVHGGILARRDRDDHVRAMKEHGIPPIDMVVVNLYPFAQTVAKPGCSMEDAIENIDIGGPAMVRAAAKNHAFVAVVTDPADYATLAAKMKANGGKLALADRYALAARAYSHTAEYDGAISSWLTARGTDGKARAFPDRLNLQLRLSQTLRYGENPHQSAAFYVERDPPKGTLSSFRQLQGKELSYNNIADADAAWECCRTFAVPRLRDRQARESLRRGDRPGDRSRPTAAHSSPIRPPRSAGSSRSTSPSTARRRRRSRSSSSRW